MEILLHTIALEPGRWTPQRVARPLGELLPAIREAGFTALEIFEPHLALAPDEPALVDALVRQGLDPVILSSYLDPSAEDGNVFLAQAQTLQRRVDRFKFRKVRLFPGRSPSPERTGETIELVAQRMCQLADEQPEVEWLLETHDGSLADEPADMVRLVQRCERPNVGLLWQPTRFDPEAARRQFAVQREHIRHVHLQNRTVEAGFTRLAEGVITWMDFLSELPPGVGGTLEFVPSGICAPEQFDLDETLREAVWECAFARSLAR